MTPRMNGRVLRKPAGLDKAVQAYELVKASSEKNRNFFVGLIALLVYAMIATTSTTDLMFFLPDSTLKLPILSVDVPVLAFYFATPIFVLLLHCDLLFNLVVHHKKLIAWRDAKSNLSPPEVQPFIFDFYALLRARSWGKRENKNGFAMWFLASVRAFAGFMIFLLPAITLALIAFWFSAFQSWAYTAFHSVCVLMDLCFVALTLRHFRADDPLLAKPAVSNRLFSTAFGLLVALVPLACLTSLLALETSNGVAWWLDRQSKVAGGYSYDFTLEYGYGVTAVYTEPPKIAPYDPRQEGEDFAQASRVPTYQGVTSHYYGSTYDYNYIPPRSNIVGSWDTGSYPRFFHELLSWIELRAQRLSEFLNRLPINFANAFPRRLDLSAYPELRRIPVEAIKLKQLEERLSETMAWHVLGQERGSIDLANRRLRFAKLQGVQLRYANLEHARLDGAYLRRAQLQYAKLDGASFRRADLTASALEKVRAHDVDFSQANLTESRWVDASFRGKFDESIARGASFVSANGSNTSFRGAELSESNFSLSQMTGADFRGANARDALFVRGYFTGATFQGANLYRAQFQLSSVDSAQFNFAMLQGSAWRGSNVEAAKGLHTAFGTPERIFLARPPRAYLNSEDVIRIERMLRINLIGHYNQMLCDVWGDWPTRHEMLGRSTGGGEGGTEVKIPTLPIECLKNKFRLLPQPLNSFPQHLQDLAIYSNAIANGICAPPAQQSQGWLADNDVDRRRVIVKGIMIWVAEISAPEPDSKNELVHKFPNLDPKIFAQRFLRPDCSFAKRWIDSLPENSRARKWLKENS